MQKQQVRLLLFVLRPVAHEWNPAQELCRIHRSKVGRAISSVNVLFHR